MSQKHKKAYEQGQKDRSFGGVCWPDSGYDDEEKEAYNAGATDAQHNKNNVEEWAAK